MEALFSQQSFKQFFWALGWTVDIRPNKVLICSDSAAALMALKGDQLKTWPDFIDEFLFILFRFGMTGCEVKFCWVPGDAGVEENEIAN